MPVLQTSEVFSDEAQTYISEFWAKAWLLRMIREKCPDLVNSILDGVYIAPHKISYEDVKRIVEDSKIENLFLRSTHPDDGVWYIWRLDNSQPDWVENDMFTDIWLDWYSKRLWYMLSSKTWLYLQKRMPFEEDSVFWNLVENPHIPWTYYISGRKRLWPASTMAGVSRYGMSTNEIILPDWIQTEIVTMFQKARETDFMDDEHTGQMEFWVNPQWEITIFQFRAFRKREEASWDLWQHTNDMSYVFWITPQTGEQVIIRTYEDIPYDDYSSTSHRGINLREEYRGKSVNADFPLENMKLI